MSHLQTSDHVDLVHLPLQPEQIQALVDGGVVRVDIPASDDIPPTVVIVRPAAGPDVTRVRPARTA